MAASTGAGSDVPHFAPLLRDAGRRVPHRRFKAAADPGFDSDPSQCWRGRSWGWRAFIPPEAGRPRKDPHAPPGGRWRPRMGKLLATKASRKRRGYTQRW